MIDKEAWRYAKRYRLDFEEVRSEAYLIFCEALKRYDSEQASFSTFLRSSMRRLGWPISYREVRRISKLEPLSIEPGDSTYAPGLPAIDRLAFAAEELSDDAREIVLRAASGDFYDPNRRSYKAGSKAAVRETLGWDPERTERAWGEAKDWWVRSPDPFALPV
jgi:hypothetical protein